MTTQRRGRIGPSTFEEFFARAERPVRFALCARYGFEVGREATADAFVYAWEHWERVSTMGNPDGYIYRVGQRLARRTVTRPTPIDFTRPAEPDYMVEPKLAPALSRLSHRQRSAVVLVHGLGMTHQETATLLGVSASTVQKHVERGLARLRQALGVDVG